MSTLMSDPDVAAGWSVLDLPPLPSTEGLDRDSVETGEAGAYHERLVSEGGRVHLLAAVNRGQAADAVHAYMTGSEGALPQAADLGVRLTVTSTLLRAAKETVGWIGNHLAEVAVAAGLAVAAAPALLPRLKAMGRRLFAMFRNATRRIGRIFRELSRFRQFSRARMTERIKNMAGEMHHKWRDEREVQLVRDALKKGERPAVRTTTDQKWIAEHGTDQVDLVTKKYDRLPDDWKYTPRHKPTTDQEWIAKHRKDQADITVPYERLPVDHQFENRMSAEVALKQVRNALPKGTDLESEAFLEKAAEQVHIKWLERNSGWASEEQKLPYRMLSEVEKEKDRVFVRDALRHWRAG